MSQQLGMASPQAWFVYDFRPLHSVGFMALMLEKREEKKKKKKEQDNISFVSWNVQPRLLAIIRAAVSHSYRGDRRKLQAP